MIAMLDESVFAIPVLGLTTIMPERLKVPAGQGHWLRAPLTSEDKRLILSAKGRSRSDEVAARFHCSVRAVQYIWKGSR